MVEGKTLITLALAVLLLCTGVVLLGRSGEVTETPLPLSFEECVERGYEILAEEPRRCVTPQGLFFVEGGETVLPPAETPEEPMATSTQPETPGVASCVVGGCSSQLCVEEGDPGMSTCEYRAEYACYQGAMCERQESGQCGWTQTPELLACLANPPALQ